MEEEEFGGGCVGLLVEVVLSVSVGSGCVGVSLLEVAVLVSSKVVALVIKC